MIGARLWRDRFGWVFRVHVGRSAVSLGHHRWPWSTVDIDDLHTMATLRRWFSWGRWIVLVTRPGRPTALCDGPARELGGMSLPGVDNDPRHGGPWAALDGATAEALDRLRPGHSREWWGGWIERTGRCTGTLSQGGLSYQVHRDDHVWSLARLPSVAVIGVTP